MSSELFSEIYNKALDILSRREHSVLELKQKLQKKQELLLLSIYMDMLLILEI